MTTSPIERVRETLRLYGQPSTERLLEWDWVEQELIKSATYWTNIAGLRPSHPRPVWGIWMGDQLHLSIGSPTIARAATAGALVTVHLDSGVDVVIVDGRVVGPTTDANLIARYDEKYDWKYDLDVYGPLTTVEPANVLAWRSGGWAGRDGFQATGRWRFTAGG